MKFEPIPIHRYRSIGVFRAELGIELRGMSIIPQQRHLNELTPGPLTISAWAQSKNYTTKPFSRIDGENLHRY